VTITVDDLVISFFVSTLGSYLLIKWDESRLDEARLERAWPPASLGAAVYNVGPIAVLIHFARTRRSWQGFALGLFYGTLIVGIEGVFTGEWAEMLRNAGGYVPR
jgi:hypothetical protein